MRLAAVIALLLLAPSAASAATPRPVPIAHGHSRFGSFSISGYVSAGDLCLSLKAGALSDTGCGFPLGPGAAADPDATGDCGRHRMSFFGGMTDRVAAVRFRYASGRTLAARVYAVPASVAAHARVYVAFAGSTRNPRRIDFYDAAGHRIQRIRRGLSGPCHQLDPFKGTPAIVSGRAPDGGDYQLRAARSRDDLGRLEDCIGVRERHKANGPLEDVGSMCGERIGDDDVRLGFAGSCDSPAQTFYFGYAVPAARAVAIELDNGQTVQATLYPTPAPMHTANSLVFAAVPGGHEVRSVKGYDAAGKPVFSHTAGQRDLCHMGGTFNAEALFP